MASWEEWIQGASSTILGAYVQERQADRQAQADLAKLQLQALGSTGAYYTEGRAGSAPSGGFELSPGLLLLIGIGLFVVLKD